MIRTALLLLAGWALCCALAYGVLRCCIEWAARWWASRQPPPDRRRGVAPDAWTPTPPAAAWTFSLDPKRGIEETRLMPGAEDRDAVPEGLGCVRPPKVRRAWPSVATPLDLLPKAERELWREALKAGL